MIATRFFKLAPWIGFSTSVILFLASLVADPYYVKHGSTAEAPASLFLLFMGWYGLVGGHVAWLANPAMSLAWFLFAIKRPGFAVAAASAALALMLSFLFQSTVMDSEAPTYAVIVRYGLGFHLWLASAAALMASSFVAAMPTDFITAQKRGDKD